jgi:hypothetical protein
MFAANPWVQSSSPGDLTDLEVARSNNRFLDKRLADLEAALVDAQLPPGPVPDQRPSRMS